MSHEGRSTKEVRPWGHMETLYSEPTAWVKILTVDPGKRLSLQSHRSRDELWVCIRGEVIAEVTGKTFTLKKGGIVAIRQGETHRLSSVTGGTIVEVAVGPRVAEDDIVRYHDDHGRA